MPVLLILQWNAQGMSGHGQELIQFIRNYSKTIHIIYIQETWFNDYNVTQIPYYTCLNKNRISENRGGGCAIYVHNSIYNDNIPCNFVSPSELHMTDIFLGDFSLTIVNYYNPCKEISNEVLDLIIAEVQNKSKLLIVGDFNSHNSLWGSDKTNKNRRLIEDFVFRNDLVILNDGSGTRLDPHSGKTSCLDLSLISSSLAGNCTWNVMPDRLGSDNFPIFIDIFIGEKIPVRDINDSSNRMWNLKNIDWKCFRSLCEKHLIIRTDQTNAIEFYNDFMILLTEILDKMSKPKNKNNNQPKSVPWWTKECASRINNRNKAKN